MRVFVEDGRCLIWTAKEWTVARENGVLGIPSLTAPAFPQQSRFLGLPVVILGCEAKFLCERHGFTAVRAKFHEIGEVNAAELPQQFVETVTVFNEDEFDVEEAALPEIDEIEYRTYSTLRDKGVWVTSGEKYGADFAVYTESPGACHASTLVWICRETIDTRRMIRAMRIAEAANKEMVMAMPAGDGIRFVKAGRWKEAGQEQEIDSHVEKTD